MRKGVAEVLLLVLIFALSLPILVQASGSEEATDRWVLSVGGLMERPHNLSYSELLTMPSSVVEARLYCVDSPPPLPPLYEGAWKGVQLKTILEMGRMKKAAVKIVFYAADGFTTDLSVEDAMYEEVIVAHELNGRPIDGGVNLPPNRLVVPGKWGYKWVAGIVRIEAVDYDFLGVYESAGYSDEALVVPVKETEPNRDLVTVDSSYLLPVAALILLLGLFFSLTYLVCSQRRRHRTGRMSRRPDE